MKKEKVLDAQAINFAALALIGVIIKQRPVSALVHTKEFAKLCAQLDCSDETLRQLKLTEFDIDKLDAYRQHVFAQTELARADVTKREAAIREWQRQLDARCKELAREVRALPKLRVNKEK